jgi:hypothetical protein
MFACTHAPASSADSTLLLLLLPLLLLPLLLLLLPLVLLLLCFCAAWCAVLHPLDLQQPAAPNHARLQLLMGHASIVTGG